MSNLEIRGVDSRAISRLLEFSRQELQAELDKIEISIDENRLILSQLQDLDAIDLRSLVLLNLERQKRVFTRVLNSLE